MNKNVWIQRGGEPFTPVHQRWSRPQRSGDWKPGRLKEEPATTQRKLELHLRERWADRIIGILLPFAKDIGLLNTLRDQEITPHKLQSIWNTFRWFSAKFGLLDPDGLERLKAKRKTIQDGLVETNIKPQRKAKLLSREVIIALEKIAAGDFGDDLPQSAFGQVHLCHGQISGSM